MNWWSFDTYEDLVKYFGTMEKVEFVGENLGPFIAARVVDDCSLIRVMAMMVIKDYGVTYHVHILPDIFIKFRSLIFRMLAIQNGSINHVSYVAIMRAGIGSQSKADVHRANKVYPKTQQVLELLKKENLE